MTEERIIGSLASAYLGKGISRGYVIYITDKRIVGVKKRGAATSGQLIATGLFVAMGILSPTFVVLFFVVFLVMRQIVFVAIDFRLRKLPQLGKAQSFETKDFDILREEIAFVEIKQPRSSLLKFLEIGKGYLQISPWSGKLVRIEIYSRELSEHVRELIREFCMIDPRITLVE